MNANELADKLMGWADDVYGGGETLIEAAIMLRQQADLIRNLQKSLGFKNSGYETINLTPQLELTDEEIDAVGDEVSNFIDTYAGRREFARAILRKAIAGSESVATASWVIKQQLEEIEYWKQMFEKAMEAQEK